jgi:hypothetical protein
MPAFLTDPADGKRFFRTGDLGRWRSDGSLEHCGRKGRKIKLRGFSVEPFEVSARAVEVLSEAVTAAAPRLSWRSSIWDRSHLYGPVHFFFGCRFFLGRGNPPLNEDMAMRREKPLGRPF